MTKSLADEETKSIQSLSGGSINVLSDDHFSLCLLNVLRTATVGKLAKYDILVPLQFNKSVYGKKNTWQKRKHEILVRPVSQPLL